ncbi:MAG: RecB-family nuclease [archaeon]
MVFEGELVIVLNEPASEEELVFFARTVFEFPSPTFVICNSPPSVKKGVAEVNRIAGNMGRSVLIVPDWGAAIEMFKPERVFYFDHKVTRGLDVRKIAEPLKADKTVVIVFGTAPLKGMEHLGLESELLLPTAVGIAIYLVQEALNPATPTLV